MIELNNLAVGELPQVMREETLMEGYWSLVRDAAAYCAELHNAGVRCSVDVFEVAADAERMKAIVAETMVPGDYILGLNRLLSHHRFKPISLGKVEDADPRHIRALGSGGLRNTGALLLAARAESDRANLSAETGVPLGELDRLVTAADLMRKPGVKATKVRLFTASGIRSLKHLGEQEPRAFRSQLEELIAKTGIVKAIPAPKEVMSDVYWARLYPVIISMPEP